MPTGELREDRRVIEKHGDVTVILDIDGTKITSWSIAFAGESPRLQGEGETDILAVATALGNALSWIGKRP